jgi:multiple sugar transport system substrate-binding protein
MGKRLSRRDFLRLAGGLAAGAVVAGCAPKTVVVEKEVEKEVTRVVKETVKETVVVEGTPQIVEKEITKVVKETVVVEATQAPVEEEVKEVTVFWRTSPLEIETMEQAFAVFKEQNPNIEIAFITGAGGEMETKLQAQFAAGSPPEVFASVFNQGLVDYAYNDMVVDLKPYIDVDKLDQSDYFQVALDTFTFGSRQFGLPRGGIPTCFFINKDLFDEEGIPYPPTDWEDETWTWDTMLETAQALTKDTDGDGQTDQYGVVFGNINYNQFPMLWGADIFPAEAFQYGITQEHHFDDPEVIKALQLGADLVWKEQVSPSPEMSQALSGLGPGGWFGTFLSGKIAMFGNLAAYNQPAEAKFNWSVAAFPRGGPSIQQRSMTWTGPFLLSKGCAHPDEGWELIKFLCGVEGQQIIAPGATVGTSRKSLLEWWLGQFGAPLDEVKAVHEGGYKYGTESPNVRTVSWRRIADLLSAEFDPLWLGEKSAEECSQSLSPQMDQLLNEIYGAYEYKAKTLFLDFPS